MGVCPYQPHIKAIRSQLNMPKGLFIFGTFLNLGILMYLASKYI